MPQPDDKAAKAPKPFELIGGHAALDLVNTVDGRRSPSGTQENLATYDDLLRFAVQSEILTGSQAKRLRRIQASPAERDAVLHQVHQLREAIASVVYAQLDGRQPEAASLATLEEHFKEAAARRHLSAGQSAEQSTDQLKIAWAWTSLDHDIAAPWWLLSQAASDLLLSDQSAHIRSCSSNTCAWLFLDTSKNHTRRWCEMKTCGNRMKARRFHARQASPDR